MITVKPKITQKLEVDIVTDDGKDINSTSEEMCFQKYAYCDGYEKGFQDAIEKAKQIIISFMPLPSNQNHNINLNIELLEERQKYAKQVAKKFEEMMLNKR